MLLRALAVLPSAFVRRIERLLESASVRFVATPGPVAKALERGDFDLLLIDNTRLVGATRRAFLQQRASSQFPDVIVFVVDEDPLVRAQLLGTGVLGVLNGTLEDEALSAALLALVQRSRSVAMERVRLSRGEPPATLADFVSHSDEMQRLLVVARRMAGSAANLLLMGETGVGKERLARAIHDESGRREGPIVAVNCGAVPEALLESELFGHEEGAFTGAVRAHRGLFELAHGGMLFLDEIGEMPLVLQVKLLRVLQERCIRPVGGERDVPIDLRIVAATNRDLQAEVQAGRFRADLYYRLAVVSLTIPPLRERRADVPVLVRNHLEAICVRLHRRPIEVHADAMAALVAHDWPGNVRELANVLERAVLLGNGQEIVVADLSGIGPSQSSDAAMHAGDLLLMPFEGAEQRVRDEFERRYFTALMQRSRGRVGAAAAMAGLSVRTLYDKLLRLGLKRQQFRRSAEALPSP